MEQEEEVEAPGQAVAAPEGAESNMSTSVIITLRSLRRDELGLVVKWTAAEGWQVSENILASCWAQDPTGFMAAEDDRGNVVGCIGGCILDDKVATGGLFIMRSDYRHRGIGKLLWEWRVSYVGNRNLSIAAASSRITPNRKAGFLHLSYEISAYRGLPVRDKLTPLTVGDPGEFEVVRYTDAMFDDVLDYDATIQTIEREAFLQQFLDTDITTTYLVKSQEGDVVGFGCVQPIEGGRYHIGPVFADRPNVAVVLFNNLALAVPEDTEVGVEMAAAQSLCKDLMAEHGFKHCSDSRRMFNRWVVEVPLDKVFFLTTCTVSLA